MGLQKRFWSKVLKTETCWIWTAALDTHGYGMFWVRENGEKKLWRSHRLAYAELVGPLPPGHEIHHECRVRHCVNPEHLRAVTRREHPDCGPALNAAKTHCPQGHPYTPENTFVRRNKDGNTRKCRTCLRAQWREREKRRTNASRGRDAAWWREYRAKRARGVVAEGRKA